mmetsp:Transcript_27623/g.64849  ORF Transcript_27623/g.64849 Transcript_27623/m.64849 type:complete len:125 (-) Transcript_27623:49-423(-)
MSSIGDLLPKAESNCEGVCANGFVIPFAEGGEATMIVLWIDGGMSDRTRKRQSAKRGAETRDRSIPPKHRERSPRRIRVPSRTKGRGVSTENGVGFERSREANVASEREPHHEPIEDDFVRSGG